MRYRTRPLSVEARARLKGVQPVRSPFGAPWQHTLNQLDTEMRALGVREEFVLQIGRRRCPVPGLQRTSEEPTGYEDCREGALLTAVGWLIVLASGVLGWIAVFKLARWMIRG